MSSQMVAWILSGIWLLVILWLWLSARDQAKQLERHEEILRNSYMEKPSQAFTHPHEFLQAAGWQASSPLDRQDMISFWRAVTQADKQRLATFIEMMPQMGLLGTVFSLFLSAFIFEFNMKMLGLALATTGFGLVGSLSARKLFEMPSEKYYYSIMELLQNDKVVERLVHSFQAPKDSQQVAWVEGGQQDADAPL